MAASTWEGATLPEEQAEPEDKRHAFHIEGRDQRFGGQTRQGERQTIGDARRLFPEYGGFRRDFQHARLQKVAQGAQAAPLPPRVAASASTTRRGKARDGGDIFRAAAQAALLAAAANEAGLAAARRAGRRPARPRLSARQACGWRGNRTSAPGRGEGAGNARKSLDRVADEQAARRMNLLRRLGDRLDHAGLVVDRLQGQNRTQARRLGQASAQIVEIEPALRIEPDRARQLSAGKECPA